MQPYSLVHLSDLHCPSMGRIKPWLLINKRATGYYNWWKTRSSYHLESELNFNIEHIHALKPQHILCSGDLTNLGTQAEQVLMLDWLKMMGKPDDVSLVLGNHDAYLLGNYKKANQIWKAYISGEQSHENPPFIKSLQYNDNRKIVVFKVNSAIVTHVFSARGRVGQAQIKRLKEAFDRYESANYFKIVMLHHPPIAGTTSIFRELIDKTQMQDLLEHCSPHLVVYGHNHKHQLTQLQGNQHLIPVIGVRSASLSHGHGKHEASGFNRYQVSFDSKENNWHLNAEFFTRNPKNNALIEHQPQKQWRFSG